MEIFRGYSVFRIHFNVRKHQDIVIISTSYIKLLYICLYRFSLSSVKEPLLLLLNVEHSFLFIMPVAIVTRSYKSIGLKYQLMDSMLTLRRKLT